MHINMFTSQDNMKRDNIDASAKSIIGKTETHWHDFYEMELVLGGEGTYVIDGTNYEIERGALFLMSPAAFHSVDFVSMGSMINVMFKGDLYSSKFLHKIFEINSHIAIYLDDKEIKFIEMLCTDMVEALEKKPESVQYPVAILECILGKISEMVKINNAADMSSMQKAILYLQNNFKGRVTLASAAKAAYVSPNYFSEQFHKYTGATFKAYVIGLRLSYAEKLLVYTNMPTLDICYECGFTDYTNFLSMFKKKNGITPVNFRKMHKK